MTDFSALLWLCPATFLGGFVDAAAGGGGLIALPAFLIYGLPAHYAYGCNKFCSTCGTTVSSGRFLFTGNMDIRTGLLSAAASFVGSFIASKLVLLLSDQVLKIIVMIALPVMCAFLLLKRDKGDVNLSGELHRTRAVILALAIGLFIGAYDGLIGPGTGTIAIFAYTAFMKYDMLTASGNAKLLNLASNYASVVTYAFAGTILYAIAIPAAASCILGNIIGSGMAIKKGAKFIRVVMMFVVAGLMIKLLFDIIS